MGYTHYMRLNREGPQDKWAEAVMAAKQIIEASPVPLGDGHGEGDQPQVRDDGIYTNGIGDDGHETLVVPTVLAALKREEWMGDTSESYKSEYFMFCKTAYKPYDVVVTAVYATLAHIGGSECVSVSSDGDPSDWEDGCHLASETLDQQIPIPPSLA